MRFLIPPQTIAEHRHNQFPVYNTWMAAAVGVAGVGAVGSLGLGIYNASKPTPTYTPPTLAQQSAQQQMLMQNAASAASQYAPQFTKENIKLQNQVTPGSSAQREKALQSINQYISGNIPADVQQQIQREVAQNLGGGYNALSSGGQAPQALARSLGQTSLGLSQYGLSAAPTWQQLANSMVASPTQIFGSALQAGEFATGAQQAQAESQYQGAMNQYGAKQAGIQGIAQGLSGLGSTALSAGMALNMANYYNSLSNPAVSGAQTTLMGTGYSTPMGATQFGQQYSQIPAAYYGSPDFSSVANVGTGMNYSSGLNFGY